MLEEMEGKREDVWMERYTETLPRCRSNATLDWSVCVFVCVFACVCVQALAMVATVAGAIRDACLCNVL